MLDAADRQGHAGAGPAMDAGDLSRVTAALRAVWPRRTVLVSRDGFVTDARRLHELRVHRYAHVVVVRPNALLLPVSVLRDAFDQARAQRLDLARLAGVPSDVCYIVSARAIALLASVGGVPGSVTLPQAIERLAGAGASIDRSPLKIGNLTVLASETSQSLESVPPPQVWRSPHLGALLSMPSDDRLAEALRLQRQSFSDARATLHRRPNTDAVRTQGAHRDVLVVAPSLYQSGAHAAWIEVSGYLSPAQVAFVVGRATHLQHVLESKGFTVFPVDEGLGPASAPDAAAFTAALGQARPAVVHFDGAEGSTWAAAAFARGARIVQHVRLNDVDRFRPAFVYAAAIVGVSAHVCAEVQARVGQAVRVEHIPDGVCLQWRPIRLSRGAGGTPVTTDGGRVLCLCVGRVEPAKGQLRVLDIFACLRALVPCRLIIVGPCGSEAAYCDEVRDRILSEFPESEVAWEPFRSEMDDLYQQAHVVLVGSRNEALGMVGLETLAAGALLVAQRSTGYESIIDPSKSEGLLFDARDTASDVALRIVGALRDHAIYAANGRVKVETCFDARDSAGRLSRLWSELAAQA